MRKVLSFVLVLSLVLGSFGMAFAAPLSDVAGEDFEDAVNVLTELGVVKGYPDGTYKPDNIVTRAEMAVIVVSALGLADYATGTAKFSDMAGHWSNGFVAYATSLGVIAGYPDGTFKPDNTVTYDEAATMLVAALGYTPDSLVGTWPANYVTKAKVLGILDGIKGGAVGANRGDIATMTYQTLDQSIGKTDKDGVWSPTIVKAGPPAEYDLMLDRLGAALFDNNNTITPGAAFVLTDTLADDAVANVRDLIGAYVTAYQNSDGDILAIKEVKSVFLTGEFDSVAGGLSGNVFEADKDYDVVDDAYYVANGDEFVNGAATALTAGAGTPAATTEYRIAADVSGIKIKNIYSISEWNIDANFQFEDDMLEDDNLNGHDFTLDDNDEIDLDTFALLGVDSLEDIAEDDVVYIYKANGEITRIEVGTEVVEGEITRINSGNTKITVGGKSYELSGASGADPSSVWPLAVEDEVKLVLDYAGDVYDLEKISGSADKLAVILDTENEAPGLAGNAAMIKLVLADGTAKVFDAAVDDISNTFINASGAWQGAAADGTVVKYSVNADGEIDALEAVETGLNVQPGSTVTADVSKTGYFDGYKIAADATIIVVDDITAFSDDEDDYDFVGRDAVLGVNVTADYVLKNGLITVMVVDAASTSDDEVYGVFAGKARVSGGTTYEVTMLVDGKEVAYEATSAGYAAVDATLTGIEAEDQLLLLTFNAAGELKDATAADDGAAGGFATTDADVNSVVVDTGVTIAVKNNVATVTATNVSGLHDWSTFASGDDITVDSDAVIYKVNADGDWVKGSVTDLKLTASTKIVSFFDVFGDDKIADIVLIK